MIYIDKYIPVVHPEPEEAKKIKSTKKRGTITFSSAGVEGRTEMLTDSPPCTLLLVY